MVVQPQLLLNLLRAYIIWWWFRLDGMQWLSSRRISLLFPPARWLIARRAHSKLFVGGLSYDTNENVLKDAFVQHGEIIEVKVICDHVSAKSKGFGFVKFTSESSASTALQKTDGQALDGRNIRVHYANKQ